MTEHETTSQGSQNQHEKKEHNHTTEHRGEHDRENQFDDPQALQSKGHRKNEPTHGPNPNADGKAQNVHEDSDGTQSGGNRPKESNVGRADHN